MKTNRRTILWIICCTFALLFAAHAFCYFNLTYSGKSLVISAAQGYTDQISAGHFLQPLYWKLRGAIASPLVIGLLSGTYICAALILLCELWQIKNTVTIFALSGALTLHVSITAQNAVSLHHADVLFLALLLSAAAVFCLRYRFGFLPAAALLTCSMAMHETGLSLFTSLALLTFIRFLYALPDVPRAHFMLRSAFSVLLGGAAFAAGYLLMSRRLGGVDMDALSFSSCGAASAASLPQSILLAYLYPLRQLFSPLTAYAVIAPCVTAILAVILLVLLFNAFRHLPLSRACFIFLCILLLPAAVNLPFLSLDESVQTSYAFCMLGVGFVLLLDCVSVMVETGVTRLRMMQRLSTALIGILFMGSIVFSNQVYLKKNLEREATASALTRVIQRAERTPGYRTGFTSVAMIGSLEQSFALPGKKGFEHLEVLDAARAEYSAVSAEETQWFIWEVLGYPFNYLSTFETEQLAQTDAVLAMPAFPAQDCVQMVGDVLVIKLSE